MGLIYLFNQDLANQLYCFPLLRLHNSFSHYALMIYSKAKLKSNDGTVSSRFVWFSNGYDM